MELDYIPVDKNAIPYHADIRIKGTTYTFGFNYNSQGDFFTVDLWKNGTELAKGEKISYGRTLWHQYADDRFPMCGVIPFDPAGEADRVGWDELGESVLLYIFYKETLQ